MSPLVAVPEATNQLVVKATPEQHARIAAIVQHIDRYTPEERLAYEVYPLGRPSPNHLVDLQGRLIDHGRGGQDRADQAQDRIASVEGQDLVLPVAGQPQLGRCHVRATTLVHAYGHHVENAGNG